MRHITESINGRYNNFTVNDIREGDIVILRNGTPMIMSNHRLRVKTGSGHRMDRSISLYDKRDFTSKESPEEDIVKVYGFEDGSGPDPRKDYFDFQLLDTIENMKYFPSIMQVMFES